jgi:uncharacterized protein (DUF488 family)
MQDSPNRVLTIGHSTMSLEAFLYALDASGVTAIADVRSSPFSRRVPHFNREELATSLNDHGIKYVYLGKELGGRPRTSDLYCDGIADYEKMALEPAFHKGLDRVIRGAKEHAIALMCSEHNPLNCHRCLLVGRALANSRVSVGHILGSGRITEQSEIEGALLEMRALATAQESLDDLRAGRIRGRIVLSAE